MHVRLNQRRSASVPSWSEEECSSAVVSPQFVITTAAIDSAPMAEIRLRPQVM